MRSAILAALVGCVSSVSFAQQGAVGASVLRVSLEIEGSLFYAVDSGDWNHDGYVDFLLVDQNGFECAYAQGGADGSFRTMEASHVPNRGMGVAGDLDGNGWAEVIGAFGDRVEIRWYDEDGPIESDDETVEFVFGGAAEAWMFRGVSHPGVLAGDLDGDQRSEVVIVLDQGIAIRWSSRGAATRYQHVFMDSEVRLLGIEDVDGDGFEDVLLYDLDASRLRLVRGDGTNTAGGSELIGPMIENAESWSPSDGGDGMIELGNFDGDPALELVVVTVEGDPHRIYPNIAGVGGSAIEFGFVESPLRVIPDLYGEGHDALVRRELYQPQLVPPIPYVVLYEDPMLGGASGERALDVGQIQEQLRDFSFNEYRADTALTLDVDTDGDRDIVWLGSGHGLDALRVTLARPGLDGIPEYGATHLFTDSRSYVHLLALDVNGDTIPELIQDSSADNLTDFTTGVTTTIEGSTSAWMSLGGDFDGDGGVELIRVSTGGTLRLFDLVGGEFELISELGSVEGGRYLGACVGDFDGDGGDDLAVVDYTLGRLDLVRLGVGGLEVFGSIDGFSADGLVKPEAIDFDQDGDLDLAIGDQVLGRIELYRNNGGGGFAHAHGFDAEAAYWLTAADVDGDGFTDLACVDNTETIGVYFLGADGVLDESVLIPYARGSEIVVADFNGDGAMDLSACGGGKIPATPLSADRHGVWCQVAPREFGLCAVLPAPESSTIAAADMNGDGAMDIVTKGNSDQAVRVHWGDPIPCPADLNADGQLDFFDVSELLNGSVDYNGDTAFDFFDISVFLQEFNAGCP